MLDIVADGSLAQPRFASGFQVPILVLDTSLRPDVNDVFDAHLYAHLNGGDDGDIETAWIGDPDSWVGLDVRFKRPIKTRAVIKFPLPKYALLVHLALKSRAISIHAGKPGAKFSDYYNPSDDNSQQVTSMSGSITLTLPHGGFEKIWGKTYRSHLIEYFKRSYKCSLEDARQYADEALSGIEDFTNTRVPRNPSKSGEMLYIKATNEESE
ncbi:hypothetical protein JOJ87_005095 [Rhodococcus ruber]|nr:hypothetical protein [Rhodococcus ruber]